METAVALVQCPDQRGLIARISGLVLALDGNIVSADEHATAPQDGVFFMRLEFHFDPARHPRPAVEAAFADLASQLGAEWRIRYARDRMRCGILVSQQIHCLMDVLYRHAAGELPMDVAMVIGNHDTARRTAEHYGVPFHLVHATKDNRDAAQAEMLRLVRESTDFLVLARYMQILTPAFLSGYGRDVVNIHHSFLPSFKGANPYQQAWDRGVKVIGATAHFVTEDLDEGPIIEQRVERVSHRDSVETLRRKGRDLERLALADALLAYTHHRVLRHRNKTIVFE